MQHSLQLTLSGYAYLHNMSYSSGVARAEVVVINTPQYTSQDEIYLQFYLSDLPLNQAMLLESIKNQTVLMQFTAAYRDFRSQFVSQLEKTQDYNIVLLNVDQFKILACYINGKRYESFTTSTLAEAA